MGKFWQLLSKQINPEEEEQNRAEHAFCSWARGLQCPSPTARRADLVPRPQCANCTPRIHPLRFHGLLCKAGLGDQMSIRADCVLSPFCAPTFCQRGKRLQQAEMQQAQPPQAKLDLLNVCLCKPRRFLLALLEMQNPSPPPKASSPSLAHLEAPPIPILLWRGTPHLLKESAPHRGARAQPGSALAGAPPCCTAAWLRLRAPEGHAVLWKGI